jgi:UDP-N-acetylglucosamine--N-acetylmuramyl-(pentapeptide) pyrophosphoryl-undecaprenol N-acetylglucosamine transferase
MRVVFCGGGTGGHVYPALAVADALSQELSDGLETLYIGSSAGAERELVARAGLPFRAVTAAAVRGRSPWGFTAGLAKLAQGMFEARTILRQFHPQAILTTGGYASIPVAVAARSVDHVPLVVFLPDVRPGWAIRFMARLARRVAVTSHCSLPFLPPGKAVVTGYPVRPAFWQATKTEARHRFTFLDQERVLFVAGATHGAHTLNQTVAKHLSQVLELCQLIHVSGHGDHPWLQRLHQDLPERLRHRYHLHPYVYDDLPWAMAAADLAVMRSGASVMGELPALGLPAVLVPYPHAGGHQRLNAQYLADADAAIVVEDNKLNGFLPLVGELLADEERRAAMAEAARRLARPNAARDIARILLEVAR